MNRSTCLIFALAVSATVVLFRCTLSPTQSAGNGSGTGNGVSAMLRNPGGSPAAHATVRFYPVNFNPRTGGLGKILAAVDSTVTDANGNYTAKLDTGAYNVLATGDSGVVYQDSIKVVKDSTINPPTDTLKAPGSLRGVIRMQPGDDARKVFIIAMGTSTLTEPQDSVGNFALANMAQGSYSVRIMSILDNYGVLDTSLAVRAGKNDTLADTIVLPFTGIPVPSGLTISYDTLKQIVTLTWNKPTTGRAVKGYNIYRMNVDSNTTLATINSHLVTGTVYSDSTGVQDQTYAYQVAAVDSNGMEGVKSAVVSVKVVSAFYISDTLLSIGGLGSNFAVQIDQNGGYVIVNSLVADVESTEPARLERHNSSGILINSWDIPGGIEGNYVYTNLAIDDSGNILLINKANQVLKYDSAGTLQSQFQYPGAAGGSALFRDTLFIGDRVGHTVSAYSENGTLLFSWGSQGLGNGQFEYIGAVVTDTAGNIYVVDGLDSARIQKFSTVGTFIWSIEQSSGSGLDISNNMLFLEADNDTRLFGYDSNGVYKFVFQLQVPINKILSWDMNQCVALTWTGKVIGIMHR